MSPRISGSGGLFSGWQQERKWEIFGTSVRQTLWSLWRQMQGDEAWREGSPGQHQLGCKFSSQGNLILQANWGIKEADSSRQGACQRPPALLWKRTSGDCLKPLSSWWPFAPQETAKPNMNLSHHLTYIKFWPLCFCHDEYFQWTDAFPSVFWNEIFPSGHCELSTWHSLGSPWEESEVALCACLWGAVFFGFSLCGKLQPRNGQYHFLGLDPKLCTSREIKPSWQTGRLTGRHSFLSAVLGCDETGCFKFLLPLS